MNNNIIEQQRWVIKNQEGNFVNRNSIRKINQNTYQYIASEIYYLECRCYISKESAEKALVKLNAQKNMARFNDQFHIEKCDNIDNIIREGKKLQKEYSQLRKKYLVTKESEIVRMPLSEAI